VKHQNMTSTAKRELAASCRKDPAESKSDCRQQQLESLEHTDHSPGEPFCVNNHSQ